MNIRALVGAAIMGATLTGCVETTYTAYTVDNYNRVVNIVNRSGATVWRFYGSNVGTSSWEEDLLGSNILRSGQTLTVDFYDGTGHCYFDFKIEFQSGYVVEDYNINVCQIGTYYIN